MGDIRCAAGRHEGQYFFLREDGSTLIELRFPSEMTNEEKIASAERLTSLASDVISLFESTSDGK